MGHKPRKNEEALGYEERLVRVPLTTEQRNSLAEELAYTAGHYQNLKRQNDEARKELKTEEKRVNDRIFELSEDFRNGSFQVERDLLWMADWDRNIKNLIDAETGEVHDTAPLTKGDRQVRLTMKTVSAVLAEAAAKKPVNNERDARLDPMVGDVLGKLSIAEGSIGVYEVIDVQHADSDSTDKTFVTLRISFTSKDTTEEGMPLYQYRLRFRAATVSRRGDDPAAIDSTYSGEE